MKYTCFGDDIILFITNRLKYNLTLRIIQVINDTPSTHPWLTINTYCAPNIGIFPNLMTLKTNKLLYCEHDTKRLKNFKWNLLTQHALFT